MNEFERASSVTPIQPGEVRLDVPDGWQQGRGAFGGLVLGALVRAMRFQVGDPERKLRSLAGNLCGPVLPGEARARVTTLRQGKSVTNVDASLLGDGEVLARASGVFAARRKADAASLSPTPPSVTDWREVAPLELGGFAPVFSRHFEYRTIGPFPFSHGAEPVTRGFIRHRDQADVLDEAAVIALLDAWWPALFSIMDAPRPIATVSFTAEILSDLSQIDASEPLAYSGRVIAQRDGFFVEFRELWSRGMLIALNQQTFAVLA